MSRSTRIDSTNKHPYSKQASKQQATSFKKSMDPYTYISKLQMQKNPNVFVKQKKKPTKTTTTSTTK
jgi:hypothetical protein